MDYWDYLAHARGAERKNHKYYARVAAGTDGKGNTKYRYFYSREELAAYKQQTKGTGSISFVDAAKKLVGRASKQKTVEEAVPEEPKKPTRAQQKDWDKQKTLNGKARLTGAYRREKHPNGRMAWVATEEYEDKDGKLKLRKKYISGEQAKDLRNNMYKKKRAEAETEEEKKARMKAAKKRYKKKVSAKRRKRAVEKGAQRVARLLGGNLTFQRK